MLQMSKEVLIKIRFSCVGYSILRMADSIIKACCMLCYKLLSYVLRVWDTFEFFRDLVLFTRLFTFVYHFANNYWSIIPTTKTKAKQMKTF